MDRWIAIFFALALLPSAVFFGIGIFLFMAPAYDKLSGSAFTEYFHAVDPYMRKRSPALAWVQWIFSAVLVALLAYEKTWVLAGLTAISLLAAVINVVIAVRGNVPLNRKMDHWRHEAPPQDWQKVRRKWLRFHDWRGIASTISFLSLLAASLIFSIRGDG